MPSIMYSPLNRLPSRDSGQEKSNTDFRAAVDLGDEIFAIYLSVLEQKGRVRIILF